MFSSPILSNAGSERGLPISCFLNHIHDSREGLAAHYEENIWLSTGGGGIGGCWDDVRSTGTATSKGSESTGIIPFMHVVDSLMLAFQQGVNRRGKYSFNLNISHPEIEEFIDIVNKKGGDVHRRCLHSFNCVSISDSFMRAVETDSEWPLIDPHSKKEVKRVRALDLWAKILTSRIQEGSPYIHYVDTSNREKHGAHSVLGLDIKTTNLCSEITLHTSPSRTAVCCLSSVNLEKYDEWKDDPLFIEDLIRMLDNVLDHFIANAPEGASKAKFSAFRERSLGLGAMGWHSYLQKNSIPFESSMALSATNHIFSQIKQQAKQASYKLAKERGAAPDYISAKTQLENDGYDFEQIENKLGLPVRNINLLAIAPNATSSIICGNTSPSIEPIYSNFYTQRTQNGVFERHNPHLEKVLESLGKNTDEVWQSIYTNEGSVQHLDFLDDHTKKVFKTAMELDQSWIVEQASFRQKFICQAQSLNLFFKPDSDKAYVHAVHYLAWLRGVKTLYYVRSKSVRKAEILSASVDRTVREEYTQDGPPESTCLACEG